MADDRNDGFEELIEHLVRELAINDFKNGGCDGFFWRWSWRVTRAVFCLESVLGLWICSFEVLKAMGLMLGCWPGVEYKGCCMRFWLGGGCCIASD
jgi:hypothetical protein